MFCAVFRVATTEVYLRLGLVFDTAGNLYGTTHEGGVGQCTGWNGTGCGVVFKLTPNSSGGWTESVLHNFTGNKDGAAPVPSLVFDSPGNLYGTTSSGGVYGYGVVFKLTRNADGSWTERVLHQSTGKDGGNPLAAFTFDSSSNLYGTASSGGAYGYGVIFKLTPTSSGGWQYRALHDFNDAPAAGPAAGLIFDGAGNLYVTTTGGDGGTVFELTP
jgi:uncharacterized repeat protein (TIGR03803 family)